MRPWRLTRRQRVEMEHALSRIRGDVGRHHAVYLGGVMAGWSLLSGRPSGETWAALREIEDGEGGPGIYRVRARVALALRAALRADEDARCEEAYFAAHTLATEEHEPLRKFARSRVWGALDAIDALREWPQAALSPKGTVPRALWEVAR